MKVTFHRDGTWSIHGREALGFWTRHYNGRVDRGVKLGDWQGCVSGGRDSPVFDKKGDLAKWLIAEIRGDQ